MPITSAFTTSGKAQALSAMTGDTWKIALYTAAATLGASSDTYNSTDEVSGAGYAAGGATLSGAAVTTDGTTAILDFTVDPSWPNSTITARGAVIYNVTKSNKIFAVLDFGSDRTSTNGTFTVQLPAATAAAGLIRIA